MCRGRGSEGGDEDDSSEDCGGDRVSSGISTFSCVVRIFSLSLVTSISSIEISFRNLLSFLITNLFISLFHSLIISFFIHLGLYHLHSLEGHLSLFQSMG